MRLIITFQTENLRLPLACNHILQSFLYRVISAEPRYGDFLHDTGYSGGDKRFKLFLFRPLSGKYTVEGKQLLFRNSAEFEIRSPDAAFVRTVSEACRPGTRFTLNGQTVTVSGCRSENEPLLQSGVCVSTLSPVTVHTTDDSRHTVYYAPEDPLFYELILRNAGRKWSSFSGDAPFDFSIEAAPGASFRRLVTTFKGVYITAWYGDFILHGSAPVLDFLYNTGLGARNSQGFGMFAPKYIHPERK